MTAPTPDARGLIERARSVAVGMRIRGERVPADMLEDLAAALEAATTPPPAATCERCHGTGETLGYAVGTKRDYKEKVPCDCKPPAATGNEALLARMHDVDLRLNCSSHLADHAMIDVLREAAAALRQRGEELAALLRDAKDVQQKWCDESNRVIRLEEQLERARDYGRRWHEAALGRSGEIDTLKARVTELEAALSAATARAEEAEADLLSHLSTGRCVLIYSQKDLDAATDAKREACAKVCDGIAEKCEFVDSEASAEYISGARDCAAAIRARQARG